MKHEVLLDGLGPKISELFDSMTNLMIKLDPNLTVDFVDKFIYSIFSKFNDSARESLLKHTVSFFEKVLSTIEKIKSNHLQNFFQQIIQVLNLESPHVAKFSDILKESLRNESDTKLFK